MKRLAVAIVLLSRILTSQGQAISKHEADSLLASLNRANTDTARMTVLFRLAQYQIFKPGEFKADLDSAETYLNKAAALNTAIGSVDAEGFRTLIAADLAKERGEKDTGKAMTQKAVRMLKTGSNKIYLAQAYRELANYYNYQDLGQRAGIVGYLDSASRLYEQAGHIEEQANCLEYLVDIYLSARDSNTSKAFPTLNRCLQAYNSIHYTRLTRVYLDYGKIYDFWGNYKVALNYKLKALQSDENEGDTSMSLCEINNSIGKTLDHAQDYEKGRIFYKRALQVAEKFNDLDNAIPIVYNIVINYNASKKLDSALDFINALPTQIREPKSGEGRLLVLIFSLRTYIALKRYPEAQVYADKLLELIKHNKGYEEYGLFFYGQLIDLYIATRQYAAASRYIQKERFPDDKDEARMGQWAYYHQFRLDSAQGNYKSATANLAKYMNWSDSVYSETNSRQINQLEIEYETEKKEHEIELGNKDIQILQSQTRFQENRLKEAALGIVVLLIVVGLIFSRYRIKQRQKKEIDQKNALLQQLVAEKDDLLGTKEWLLKELHHRVKNNLQVMMSLQELQARNLTSDEALTAVHDSSNRLYAMSLIHQKLYKADGPDQINMRQYIGELARHLADAFASPKAIKLELDLTADIELDVTQAIPVGLILNEAITNVFKYAFVERTATTANSLPPPALLRIALYYTGQKEIELMIKDNGRGYPAAQDKNQRRSLGFSLMEALAEELDGTLDVLNEAGLTILLRFAPFKGKTPTRTVPLEAAIA